MADARRQLRSGTVALGGVGLLAMALTACSSDPDKRCVDRDSYTLGKGYRVVADKNCKSSTSVNGSYYYGGKKKGSWVSDGSFTKSGKGSGSSSSSTGGSGSGGSGVDRGGFGSGGSGDGGGVGKGSSGG
ncbi:hypothetical protein M2164_003441 [Streptomyces sp. SAI-208]|uniref:hypothetical protein n=1 Tax=unclassified Streptomyces TaxID=2593676 RepID=UPI002473A192|nr:MULTISPECIES: hypothetical protein [unclassified Streptomyces]MDH6516985.1 hypothetical protein [Streptomyces sp. SAI-090]MDH6549202.1 hypothetical protein [Streptomyces sp. SAI-041]MDH6568267.1 hypothetical protein [Streptomyces sp. SAI-117]MDH6607806.1 hypothetical protein [Streptomyces sp. SAI-208]MDH6618926.1 hypothetical protein [Streptomyces sp. SAI-135]